MMEISKLVQLIYGGYPLLLICVIVLLLIAKQHRKQLYHFLGSLNLLLASGAVLSLALLLYELSSLQGDLETYALTNRATGPYWLAFWFVLLSTVIVPQLFWFRKFRSNIPLSLLAAFAPFYEKLVIIITSYHRDYLPSSWSISSPLISMTAQAMLCLLMVTLCFFLQQLVETIRQK